MAESTPGIDYSITESFRITRWLISGIVLVSFIIGSFLTIYNIKCLELDSTELSAVKRAAGALVTRIQNYDPQLARQLEKFVNEYK